ncbi:glucosamine-6-phosphate deaminase [Asaia astilbis]|uniref:glucosamine-6-phosphate deaminase n=1 Tax=Asaia astilbis TaxID=610244 RepID=UPI00046F7FFB|nr:glucosamine-6-phosphate deaminase [Asaia astilbis]
MRLVIMPDPTSATQLAASAVMSLLSSRDRPVLGLATGRTMEGVYRDLCKSHDRDEIDFSKTTTFNLDEYVGLSSSDPESYRHYMQDHLFDHVNIAPDATHLPDGTAENLDAECASYEAAIARSGGIDLQLLGIGETGHIGFNEPPSAFDTRTRCVTLTPTTRQQNAAMFGGDPAKVPEHALTMGVGTILEARQLLLLALGDGKAAIVARALEGEVGPEISASAIRLHARCTVILDEASASLLSPETLESAKIHRGS